MSRSDIAEDGAEIASEATDFFDTMQQSVTSLETDIEDQAGNSQGDPVSWEVRSLSSLRSLVDSHDSRGQLKTVPRMTQPHFITLWKTLYELFQAKPHDQEVIHSIATIGTLLLQLGDVGKKFYLQKEDSLDSLADAAAAHWADPSQVPVASTVIPDRNGNPGTNGSADPHWSISVEQFLATVLTGPPIAEFFSHKTSISDGIARLRGRRFSRLHSFTNGSAVIHV